jgi:hypothetical protein
MTKTSMVNYLLSKTRTLLCYNVQGLQWKHGNIKITSWLINESVQNV